MAKFGNDIVGTLVTTNGILFNLIINDDGSCDPINAATYSIITKFIWNEDAGYHRVARFNESVALCVSPYIILLDDDCIPTSNNFIQAHLDTLKTADVSRGIIKFWNGQTADGWFSTANLGIRKTVLDAIGLFDINFDGNYGHEDIDFGKRLQDASYVLKNGEVGTQASHGNNLYANGDRSVNIIGHNTKYFTEKWGLKPSEI